MRKIPYHPSNQLGRWQASLSIEQLRRLNEILGPGEHGGRDLRPNFLQVLLDRNHYKIRPETVYLLSHEFSVIFTHGRVLRTLWANPVHANSVAA